MVHFGQLHPRTQPSPKRRHHPQLTQILIDPHQPRRSHQTLRPTGHRHPYQLLKTTLPTLTTTHVPLPRAMRFSTLVKNHAIMRTIQNRHLDPRNDHLRSWPPRLPRRVLSRPVLQNPLVSIEIQHKSFQTLLFQLTHQLAVVHAG